MKKHTVGIIMNVVTGRMGTNQHLMRSIVAIIKQGGGKINDDEVILPKPVLIGRNLNKLENLKKLSGIGHISTDLDAVLADPAYQIYFDAQITNRRVSDVRKAIAHGKHVYCEKPSAGDAASALELYKLSEKAKVKK